MRKRLFAALRWIDFSKKTLVSKLAQRSSGMNIDAGSVSDVHLDPDRHAAWEHPANLVEEELAPFTQTELAARLGTEEWFLAYELDSKGIFWGDDDETTAYSLALITEEIVQVRSYDMRRDPENGNCVTLETECRTGTWEISGRLLTLHLPDEVLEFILARMDGGTALMVDPDDGSLSVFMTESALHAELRSEPPSDSKEASSPRS